MVTKNRRLFYLLAGWELVKSLVAYIAAGAGLVLPLWPGFRLEVPIPRIWPSADMVLPHPYLTPNAGFLLNLLGTDRFYQGLMFFCVVLVLDTFFKGLFVSEIIAVFHGKKLGIKEKVQSAVHSFNRYFILAWAVLIWYMFGNIISQLGTASWLIFKSITILGAVLFIFVDIAIQYHDFSISEALQASLQHHGTLGEKGFVYILAAAAILGCLSVPINWAVSFYPALMLSIIVFAFFGAVTAAGLVYLYTATEQIEQQC